MVNIITFYYHVFHVDTLCFDEKSYMIMEDKGPLNMTLTLSKPLPFDITVKFLYEDLKATGKLMM